MKKPRKRNAVDDALDALLKRKGQPTEEDRPPLSAFPGKKVRPIEGQLDLNGNEVPRD